MSIANAGHPAPRLRRRDGTVSVVGQDRIGFPLGLIDDTSYRALTIAIDVGDEFILFTDGVTEAFNRQTEIYGTERLHNSLSVPVANAAERVQSLVADVERFRQGRKPSDDQCILVVWRTGE